MNDFYKWLQTQFTDLDSAKQWIKKWYKEEYPKLIKDSISKGITSFIL